MKNDNEKIDDSYNQGIIKFIQFIQNNQIQIEQFWEKHQIYVSTDQFRQFLYSISFPDTDKWFKQIVLELKDSKKNITLEKLCKRVPYWNNSEEIMIDHIKQKALRIVQSAQRQRPQSGIYSQNRPMSGISMQSKYSAFSDLKNLNVINDDTEYQKIPIINKSKQYLKIHGDKQKEIDKLLQITIKKGQYEYEYETQMKMAELNDIVSSIKSCYIYKSHKNQDGEMRVHQYENSYFVKDFSLDEFQREYNIVKQQYSQFKKQIKKDKVEVQKEVNKDEQQQPTINIKQIKQKERLQELKQVLLETMMLSNVMKQQITVLNKKGINSDPLFTG